MKNKKGIFILIVIVVAVFGLVWGGVTLTQYLGKSQKVVTTEQALTKLERLYKSVGVTTVTPRKGTVSLSENDLKSSLPDISKYPSQGTHTTNDYIEIFSSTEKAGTGTDGWLVDVANQFNQSGATVNGKSVSVEIRGIASGAAVDYISSGKYVPDAFSPSNELWGEMLKADGVQISLAEKRIAGNVAGILTSKKTNATLVSKYGSVSLKTITEAVSADEIQMGYTNPFASSTGLNFLVSTLSTFDAKDPLSDTATAAFEKFQQNIPYVAYTTLQMRDSAKSGVLDGFILEYQTYANAADLKSSYIFTPFGVRHDSPVYALGTLSDVKQQILTQFIAYCKAEKAQKLATKDGFNNLDTYKAEIGAPEGSVIVAEQKLWKEKKNSGSSIKAVFVADTSGSMEGEPLTKLKQSLLTGAQYISSDSSVGFVTFSNDVKQCLPVGAFDLNQRSLFAGAVEDMQAGGGTAMFDGIIAGAKMLMDEKAKDPNAKLMLFVLTDGETNAGHSLNDVSEMLKTLRIPVYTIGYNADVKVLQNVSNINEAASINADTDDVVYKLQSLFNAQI